MPLLQFHLQQHAGLLASADTIRRELWRLRYSWKRPRSRLDPDPEARGKKEAYPQPQQAVATAKRGAGAGRDGPAAVPATAFVLVGGGPAQEVLLSGGNARRVVFGARNLRTGSRFTLVRQRQRAADFQEFLKVLHDRYRGWHVAILLDEDPSPTAKASVRRAEPFDVEPLGQPKRMPELNPMDTLWGQAKDVVGADKQYPSLDEQVARFSRHVESQSPHDALQTAGVLSDDFWLRDVL